MIMNELIQYFQALEARLAAQDAKIAALEQRLAEKDRRLADMNDNLNSVLQVLPALSENIESIKQMLKEGVQVSAEPDVEVELVYPEDEEATVELPQETPAAEPEPAPQPEPVAEPEPQPEQVVEQPAPEPVVEQPQPEPVVEQPKVEQPVAEQPKPEAPRAPQQTSLFGTPVTDIRQAVSIGDRFLFQRELFGGNAEKLQQTLTELNNLHSLDEAVALVDKFGWDKQSPTYELFLNVLRRRFQ
jgi:uncharacterized coiled-coil protein SlyX